MEFETLVRNGQLVIAGQGIIQADLGIRDGTIAAILSPGAEASAAETIDAAGKVVLPGRIEPHSHIGLYRDPVVDLHSETRAAAAGGVTTFITFWRKTEDYLTALPPLIAAGEQGATVDFAISLGMQLEEHLEKLDRYIRELGVSSFKFFLGYKGTAEGIKLGHTGVVDDGFVMDAMRALAPYQTALFEAHAENVEIMERLTKRVQESGQNDLAAWTAARPDYAEAENWLRMGYFARLTGCPIYAVHVTCIEALEVLKEARRRGQTVWVETCHHYLRYTKDSPLGMYGKVNPPLRDEADVEALWTGLADGSIDTVGADHAYFSKSTKGGDVWAASPGVGQGTGTVLPLLLSEGVNRGRLSLERVAEVTSTNPAKAFNLFPRKGMIAVGSDADLTIVDLNLTRTVDLDLLKSDADFAIWEGETFTGWPVMTIVRGKVVMRDGEIVGQPGYGRYVRRPPARGVE
ncbi:MAG: amidohydrolase family protein [Dehalococcoidia bacterium]